MKGGNRKLKRFYDWIDEGDVPVLVIDGPIDSDVWWGNECTPRIFREELDGYAEREILVSINSPGGDVFAAFEIYNMLKERSGVTGVRVMGMAASAASLICMAADTGALTMCPASMMMIHKPAVSGGGNADEMRKNAQVLDQIEDIMVEIYMQRFTGGEDALRAMLAEERYLSPREALALGLCDAVAAAQEETQSAVAAMLGPRFAAMDADALRQIRAKMHIDPPKAPPKTADTHDYLAMADALIADMAHRT